MRDGESGIFFHEQTPEALCAALDAFEQAAFSPNHIAALAGRFNEARFRQAFAAEADALLEAFSPLRGA